MEEELKVTDINVGELEIDIKILKEFLAKYKLIDTNTLKEIKPTQFWGGATYVESNEFQAMYNILNRLEQLEKENKELKKITQMYDAFGNDYMENNVKMIIADREYFHNGIFNESFIPKSVIREKIEEYLEEDKKYKRYLKDGRECFTFNYFVAKELKKLLGGSNE